MSRSYHYNLTVWLRFELSDDPTTLGDRLQSHLGESYSIHSLKVFDPNEGDFENECQVCLQLQMAFREPEVVDEEPTDEAIEELADELQEYLEPTFEVTSVEILDDALTTYLLGWDDDEDDLNQPPQ